MLVVFMNKITTLSKKLTLLSVFWAVVVLFSGISHAASPFAGFYTGNVFVSVSGAITIPESAIGVAFFTVDSDGNISGNVQGTVDGSGNITWQPNDVGFTTGMIDGMGNLTATTSSSNGLTTTTTRIGASNQNGGFGNGGSFVGNLNPVNPSPTIGDFNAVIYGDNKYVAVGAGGVIVWSGNGTDWTPVNSGVVADLNDVAFGNGTFVAVGDAATILTSTDAINWTPRSANVQLQNINCVAFGNGTFVAGPNNFEMLRSTDNGASWSFTNTGLGSLTGWTVIDYVNGRFVAHNLSGSSVRRIVTSTNGSTWTSPVSLPTNTYFRVAYGNGTYVILGDGNKVITFTSADGSGNVNNTVPSTMTCVVFDGTNFLGINRGGNIYQSSNGASWTLLGTTEDTDPTDMIHVNGQFLNVGSVGRIRSSTDGLNWTARNRDFTGAGIKKVAQMGPNFGVALSGGGSYIQASSLNFGNLWTGSDLMDADIYSSLHILVGLGGTMLQVNLTGSVGTTQRYQESPTTEDLYGIGISGNGTKAAVGANGTIVTAGTAFDGPNSTFTWTERDSGVSVTLRDAEGGDNTTLLAVGDNGTILRADTSNLDNWAPQSSGTSETLLHAYYGGSPNQFVVVGTRGTVLTSPDGLTWTTRTPGIISDIVGVTYVTGGSPGYFLVAVDGTILKSTDQGVTWVDAGISLTEPGAGLAALNSTLVVFGTGKEKLHTSDQGATWTRQTLNVNGPSFYNITRGPDKYVLAGSGTGWSTDGQTWHFSINSVPFEDIAYGAGIYVGVGAASNLQRPIRVSYDGILWRQLENPMASFTMNGVHYANGMFVATGNSGTIITSPDGLTWTERTLTSATLNAVTYGGGMWVIVGDSGQSRYSMDGVTWMTSSHGGNMNAVSYANGLFVAVGDSGGIRTSVNGINWTSRSSGVFKDLRGVEYINGVWVAVGLQDGSSGPAVVTTSTDGITWTKETSNTPRDFYGIGKANGQAFVFGESGVIQSLPFQDTASPLVVSNPMSQTINAGGTLNLSASVTGDPTISYRWLRNGVAVVDGGTVSGATTANLTITGVAAEDDGEYVLEVSNDSGIRQSLPATVTVNLPPTITSQPESQSVGQGGSASFSVMATGDGPFTYVWKRDGVTLNNDDRISGATTATITIDMIAGSDAGFYTVEVTNAIGTTPSDEAALSVSSAPAGSVSLALNSTFNANVPATSATTYWVTSGFSSPYHLWYAGVVQPDGKPIQVGAFQYPNANSLTRYSIRRLNTDGTIDGSFDVPLIEIDRGGAAVGAGRLTDVDLLSDGRIVVVGDINKVGGASLSGGIAMLNADGTHHSAFAPTIPGQYYAVAVDSLDRVIVAGYDTSLPSGSRFRVYWLDPADGSVTQTFNAPASNILDFSADTMFVQSGDKVVFFGYDQDYDSMLVRLTSAGALDGTFSSPKFDYSVANHLVGVPGGGIFVPGRYLTIGTTGRKGLALLTEDGVVDSSFGDTGATTSDTLSTFNEAAVFTGGTALVGGNFNNIFGQNQDHLALMDATGAMIEAPVIGTGTDFPVNTVMASPNGSIAYVGGPAITTLNGQSVPQLFRLDVTTGGTGGPLALEIVSQSADTTVFAGDTLRLRVAAVGDGSLTYFWSKDGGPVPGGNSFELVIPNVDGSAEGTYSVRVTDSSGFVDSADINVTVVGVVQNLTQWLGNKGLTMGVNDGPGQDPDNDRIPTIAEFAFGSHPNNPGSGNRPFAAQVQVQGTFYPAVCYIRNPYATGVSINVSVSVDLGLGFSAGSTTTTVTPFGNGLEMVTVRANVSVNGGNYFFHVYVTQNP